MVAVGGRPASKWEIFSLITLLKGETMERLKIAGMMAVGIALTIMIGMASSLNAGGHIKRGGTLNYIFGSKIPSYDLHRETTFGVIDSTTMERD